MNLYQPKQLRKAHERKTRARKKEMKKEEKMKEKKETKEIKKMRGALAMSQQTTKLVIAIVVLGLLTGNAFF